MTVTRQNLRSRALRAGIWTTALRGASYALGFVRAVVVARLLAPHDVGLFAITLLTIAALEVFTETGFREALIQRGETIEDHLSTAWTVQVLRNLLIATALVAGAPLVADLFREPESIHLVRAVSIAVLLSGFENTGIVRFERHLDFGPLFRLNVAGIGADLLVSGAAAYVLRSPWALVLGLIVHRLARTVASFILSPYRPRVELRADLLRQLYGYGIWMLARRVVHFVSLKGDDVVVGRLLGAYSLGIYQMAFQIGEMAAREITTVIGSVAFPAYSRMQSELGRVRASFLLTIEFVACVVLPVAAASVYLAEPIVLLLLGSRWIDVAVVLPILVWSAAIRGLTATAGGVYLALGKPRYSFQVSLLRAVVLFSLVIPLARRFELQGVAWAVLVSTIAALPFAWAYVRRLMDVDLAGWLRHLLPGIALAIATSLPFLVVDVAGLTGPVFLWLAGTLALILYAAIAALGFRTWGRGPLRLLALMTGPRPDAPPGKGEAP